MRIFVYSLTFYPRVSGQERVVGMLCEAWAAAGHEVRLATDMAGPWDDAQHPFAVLRRPDRAAFAALSRWGEVTMHASLNLRRLVPALRAPVPLLVQHHYDYRAVHRGYPLVGRLKGALVRWLPGIAVSGFLGTRTGARHVILNPYDAQVFDVRVPWEARTQDLLHVGRLDPGKGTGVLLAALGRLAAQGLRPGLTVVGDGPERAALAAQAAALGLGGQVWFAGALPPAGVAAAMNAHRAIVVPSTIPEAFGLVAVEGLACGCLPVVSDIGGLGEAVGRHGVRVPPGDAGALAGALAPLVGPGAPPACLEGAAVHLASLRLAAVARRYVEVFEAAAARARARSLRR